MRRDSLREAHVSESQVIRAIIFRDGHAWIGQCLEFDIGAQAESLDELRARLKVAVDADRRESIRRGGEPFEGIDPAPQHFHDMWERRSGDYTPIAGNAVSSVKFEMGLCA